MDRIYGQSAHHSSATSSSMPSLHSRALDPFANGLGDISMAVLANPAKIQETIRELSNHEPNPPKDRPAVADDIMEDEKMNLSDVTRSADDLLMEKMETAGFHNNEPKAASTARKEIPAANASLQQDRFFDIPQPAAEIYDQAVDDQAAGDDPMYGGFDQPMPLAGQPTDSFHARFTAPKSELDASGVHANEFINEPATVGASGAARTQSVRINTDKNVVNTFDNSIYATQGGVSQRPDGAQQPSTLGMPPPSSGGSGGCGLGQRHDASESASGARSGSGSGAVTATESDATAYQYQMRERDRQRRKKERRRRERLPHERTYGEMQEERYEDWERKIQQDVKEAEDTEKRELLLLFSEKEQEGYKMLRQFNMSSNLNEMRFWYYKLLRDTRTDDEVAHLRSHLVEGTRILLYLNENVFSNPLGLSDMVDFPDALASMLIGSWDRHIRDYVKSKNGLQGPPPQPLRNLGLNFLHLFISHHRKKAAEEQKEKAKREAEQREAMLAAAQRGGAGGNVALNPFEAIFGDRTNYMRGREGVNPMELPPYANATTVPAPATANYNAEYAEFLHFKRAQEDAEYRAFLAHKRGANPMTATAAARATPVPPSVRPTARPAAATVATTKEAEKTATAATVSQPRSAGKKTTMPPPSFLNDNLSRMKMTASPLPNDLGPPEVASIDVSSDFQAPASHNSREQLATTHASNSGLVGETNASKSLSQRGAEESILLSTSAAVASETDESISERKNPTPPVAKRAPLELNPRNGTSLPRAYQTVEPGAKLLQNIGKRGGITDERLVPLPPVPDITRDHIKRLQERLVRAKEQQAKETKAKTAPAATTVAAGANLKALRPMDRERVAKLLSSAPPRKEPIVPKKEPIVKQQDRTESEDQSRESGQSASESTVSESTVGKRTTGKSTVVPPADDYEALLEQMEAECDALGEDEEAIMQYNDVKSLPKNAVQMDSHKDDNRILDMLTMFQNFLSGPAKGTRPTAQTSMFSDLDGLMATDGKAEIKSSQKTAAGRRKRVRIADTRDASASATASGTSNATASRSATDENGSNGSGSGDNGGNGSGSGGKSSTTSFRLASENQNTAAKLMDSRGHLTW